MTLRQTQIIEWSTTPQELRRIADRLEKNLNELYQLEEKTLFLEISIDEGQWRAEQVEDKG
jgi:hypothetical protein